MEKVVWHKETRLEHPSNGTPVFGHMHEIKVPRGPTFSAAPIVLKYGEHFLNGSGFGFEHVWKAHFASITDHDEALTHIRNHVAACLNGVCTVFYERQGRLETARFKVGNLILQAYSRPDSHYSVVSGGYIRSGKGTLAHRFNPATPPPVIQNEKGP
ncbi:TPA: hypothetical protein ACOFBV_001267 [Stenotrophomonas maltophilia]|uniref:hypothetical protein n=1 Tax=Stenotrophomonas maltophilia TaxID=40324 RepID=UPI0039C3D255